jgi:carbon monoxide dehydrogenase subunit G
MKVEGTRKFDAPQQTVWEVLNDPARMAKLMPGVESFDVQDDKHWTAKVKIPLGLGGLPMTLNFEKTEERPIDYARLSCKGQGVGAMLNLDTQFHLSGADGGGTDMKWEANVSLAGPVGGMGQRVLQPIVNQQVGNVLQALQTQVEEAKAAEPGEVSSSEMGTAGSDKPRAVGVQPATDPTVRDAGPPAEGPADPEGTSGAEEGLNPWAPESYEDEPEGPTTSTED